MSKRKIPQRTSQPVYGLTPEERRIGADALELVDWKYYSKRTDSLTAKMRCIVLFKMLCQLRSQVVELRMALAALAPGTPPAAEPVEAEVPSGSH
jgi:hypothetical protein